MKKFQFELIKNAEKFGYCTVGNAVLEAVDEKSGAYACAGYDEEGKIQIDYFDGNGFIEDQKIVELFDLDKTENAPTFEQALELLKQINENKNN